MAYVITDGCVSCGTCAGECPVGAISEGDGKYVIDADSCIECGTLRCACPTGAIEWLNYKLHKKPQSICFVDFFFYHIINVKKDVIHHDSKKPIIGITPSHNTENNVPASVLPIQKPSPQQADCRSCFRWNAAMRI